MNEQSSHRSMFRDYIRAGVQASLARVQAVEHTLPELDRQQAWHLLSFALDLPEVWDETRALLLALAPKMEQAGFRMEWLVYLMEGHRRSQTYADWQTSAECELQMGILHRMTSRFEDAMRWLTASVEHFATLGNSFGERRALNELAWLEQLQHKYTEASQHVERALALSTADDIERGMSLRVHGMIANSQRKWQEAQAYHEQALAIFEKWQDQRKTGWSLQNLAIALHEQSKFEEANTLYNRAFELIESLGDTYHVAIINMNLGVAHYRFGKPAAALPYLAKAAEYFHSLSDHLNIARTETNLGLCQHAVANYPAAERAFLAAIDAYAYLKDHMWRLNAVAGLGMTYIAKGEYDRAINVLEPAIDEIESIRTHPYYSVTLNYLQQYLAEAKQGQG